MAAVAASVYLSVTPAMPEPPDNSLLNGKDIFYCLAGAFLGGLITHIYYLVGKKSDERSEKKIALAMARIQAQGRANQDRLDELLEQTRRMPKVDQLKFLETRFEEEKHLFASSHGDEAIAKNAIEYTAIANAHAYLSSEFLQLDILDRSGHISIDQIVKAHKKLFPADYAWAGELRKKAVQIAGTFRARGRSVTAGISSITISVTPPEQIIADLEALCESWNSSLGDVRGYSRSDKCRELAHFHHQFELIHPFLDGNGRIGRAILREQASCLFGNVPELKLDKGEYLQAMRLADQRSSEKLVLLIERALNVEEDS